jgi:hypothetical protein
MQILGTGRSSEVVKQFEIMTDPPIGRRIYDLFR